MDIDHGFGLLRNELAPGFATSFKAHAFCFAMGTETEHGCGYIPPRDDVPDISRNTVDSEVVEVGLPVAVVGAAGMDQAGHEVAGLQVAHLEDSRFHLHSHEASAHIDNCVVLGGVAYGPAYFKAVLGGFGHETKLSPLASLFVVAYIHAGSFHDVSCTHK